MKKNESGRSMVEMLGVLAIIGVLSIGGIAGYTLAMNRYRANEIIDAASKVAVIAMSANRGEGGTANLGSVAEGYTVPGVSTMTGYANGLVEIGYKTDTSDAVKNLVAELTNSTSNTNIQIVK